MNAEQTTIANIPAATPTIEQMIAAANGKAKTRTLDPEEAVKSARSSYAWGVSTAEALGLSFSAIRVKLSGGTKLANSYAYSAECTILTFDGKQWQAARVYNQLQGRYGSVWLVIEDAAKDKAERKAWEAKIENLKASSLGETKLSCRKDGDHLVIY